MAEQGTGVEVDPEELKRLLLRLKELPPKVRTATRRELRAIGDETIAEQRATLNEKPPTGRRKRSRGILVMGRREGKLRVVGRHDGLREGIKAGLKLRIVTGKTRQGVELKTTGPREYGYNLSKLWQKREFRHPVFGKDEWVEQSGKPYFFAPALRGRDEMVRRAAEILKRATE